MRARTSAAAVPTCAGCNGHLDYRTAVAWLEQHLAPRLPASGEFTAHHSGKQSTAAEKPGTLRLPVPDDRLLGRVRQYLTCRRGLAGWLIAPLVQSGKLDPDNRGKAVFLLGAGKAQRPVGAELRGTGPPAWRGMAPGTRKDWGYFWIGTPGSREIVLCESAIDAISCFQIHPQRICISTSGVRADPPWLDGLLAHGYQLYCSFDADAPGDAAATRMLALYPAVRRLRPPAHDWNDALTSSR